MKRLLLCLSSLLLYCLSWSQSSNFIISSIGSFPGTQSNITAVKLDQNNACIDVKTGLPILTASRGKDKFIVNCEFINKYKTLGLRAYPNPAKNSTKIDVANMPPVNDLFTISLFHSSGVLIRSFKETGYRLFQGLNIDLMQLAGGTYVVKVESNDYLDAMTFVIAR